MARAKQIVCPIQHTELATRLRTNKEKLEGMTGYRIKVVEKGGTKLVDLLHKAKPWAGQDCGRARCMLCETKKKEGKKNSQDCIKRNCVYETYCMTCTQRQDKETNAKIHLCGETNRSVYERGMEHQNDIPACKTSSHMLRHLLMVHEDEEEECDKIEFGMRLIRSTRTAFERQILESVTIQKSRNHNIMNNKAKYNRCAILRLTAKLGEKDMEKWRKEDREEMLIEASIEEKIRMRKKDKAKKRADGNKRREQ